MMIYHFLFLQQLPKARWVGLDGPASSGLEQKRETREKFTHWWRQKMEMRANKSRIIVSFELRYTLSVEAENFDCFAEVMLQKRKRETAICYS